MMLKYCIFVVSRYKNCEHMKNNRFTSIKKNQCYVTFVHMKEFNIYLPVKAHFGGAGNVETLVNCGSLLRDSCTFQRTL